MALAARKRDAENPCLKAYFGLYPRHVGQVLGPRAPGFRAVSATAFSTGAMAGES